ncbi:MAG: META domain-containing protein [Chitinophagaceae bacterium]
MKMLFFLLTTLVSIIVATGCQNTKVVSTGGSIGSEMLYKSKWYLSEVQGKNVNADNGNYAYLLFSPGQPNKVTGSTGCNRLNGSYDLSGVNFIKFSPLASTRMACPGNTEATFLDALGQANSWNIVDNQLLLSNGKIQLAKFNAVSMEMDKLSGTWDLNYISGQRIAFDRLYPDKKPTVSFNFSQKELSGNTTCNGFTSKYTITGNSIKFDDALKTMIFCEGGGEEAFLNMLKKVNRYALTDEDKLTFLIDDAAVIRFAKRK